MSQIDTFFYANKSACQVDVRSKIFILFAISIAIFFVDVTGLSVLFALFVLLIIIDYFVEFKDRPQEFPSVIKAVLKVATPLYIICAISFLANAIIFTGDTTTNPYSLIPNPLGNGGLYFTHESVKRGVFYSGRILLLGWSSLYVANTMSLINFASAFKWFFWPLRKLKVPVSDASLAASIALRFIPEIFIEFQNIREAQWCRGARVRSGSVVERVRSHASCFVPLIVRMMSNVDALSEALTARCWGVYEISPKDELNRIPASQILFLIIVCFLIVGVVALV